MTDFYLSEPLKQSDYWAKISESSDIKERITMKSVIFRLLMISVVLLAIMTMVQSEQTALAAGWEAQNYASATFDVTIVGHGQSSYITPRFRNTGTNTWPTSGDNVVALNYRWESGDSGENGVSAFSCSEWVSGFRSAIVELPVSPNSIGQFTFRFCNDDNMSPGTYTEHYGVGYGSNWMPDGNGDVAKITVNITVEPETIIYVKADATGSNDGSSWENAYTDLQEALSVATAGDQIWVAAGTYQPTDGADRDATFQLKNGVAIYGGFSGTETTRHERDWVSNPTILSGDINGNDNDNITSDEPTRAENSYHVVTANSTDSSAILDGFVITGGNANGSVSRGGGMYNSSGSPTVSNVTFTDNSASNRGGGMLNSDNSSPTVSHVTFTGNSASSGGGMYNVSSSPMVTNVTFSHNSAITGSGGGMRNDNSSPTVSDVIFTGNSANINGGGMANLSSSPTVSHVTLTGNSANNRGGGMSNSNISSPNSPTVSYATFSGNLANSGGGMHNFDSNPTVSHVTFTGNSANFGGGMFNTDNSSPVVSNAIFTGNSASQSGGGMSNNDNSSPVVSNVTFAGNSASFYGGGMQNNENGSPTVTNVTFIGNLANTSGGGMYNLWDSSPTVSNSILWNNKDSSGTGAMAQIHNDANGSVNVSYSLVQGGWSGTNNIDADPLFISPINPDDAPTTAGDFHLQPTSPAIDAGDNSAVPADTADLDGDGDTSEPLPFDFDGQLRFWDSPVISDTGNGTPPIVDMGAYEMLPIIYVKANATGTNNGESWENAYTNLQDALAVAIAGDEIWVAAGTYQPTEGADRHATFQLKNGVAIYGGFSGTEITRDERNWLANPTILSGDPNGNDNNNIASDEPTRAENSYHVVTGSGTDNSAMLDGFIVRGGNANALGDSCPNSCGGGMFNSNGHPVLSNLIFTDNSASHWGGGMYNENSNPTISYATFIGNSASHLGGGMTNFNSSLTISNAIFRGNWASSGGGMVNGGSSPTISHAIFSGNFASDNGGAMYNALSSPTISHAVFSSNLAGLNGGAMHNFSSNPIVSGSILWNNKDSSGTGPTAQISGENGSQPSVSYSLVQGDWSGTGNINADPLFVTPIDPDNAPTTAGDFRLQPTSPAIDAADNSAVPADTTDLDDDGDTSELLPLDLAGHTRFVDSPVPDTGNGTPPLIDMGPYENDGTLTTNNGLTSVMIDGPTTGLVQSSYPFTATISPISATLPITYVWQASGQAPVTYTSGVTNTISLTLDMIGTQTVTVTASNGSSVVENTHQVVVMGDMYEPNDTCQEAYEISASQLYTSYLSHSEDEDYYAIEVTEPFANLMISKNGPPEYVMALYDDCTEGGGLVLSTDENPLVYNVGLKTGWYYLRLNSPDGFSGSTPYTLQVDIQPTDTDSVRTLILLNQSRLEAFYGVERTEALVTALNSLANHPAVQGLIIPIEQDATVSTAYQLWDESPESTSRANEVTVAIKNLLTSTLETFPSVLEDGYLVLVGDDRVIPFHRVPVDSGGFNFFWLPESEYAASNLRQVPRNTISSALFDDQTLTDDFYADLSSASHEIDDHELYLPNLAIGRLVEEPEQMMAVIDAFLTANGQVTFTTGAVSAYGVGQDVGHNQCNTLTNDGLSIDCSLVTAEPFTAQELISVMLEAPHDVTAMNGNSSHHEYLASDGSAMTPNDLLNVSQDLSALLLVTTGSQSGLNVPAGELHEMDWAQSLASRGVTYVSHTGWTYGLGHTIGLTEKIMGIFTEKLVAGTSSSVGYALKSAKQEYFLFDNYFDYYDEKVIIQTTLFGLPQWQLHTPAGSGPLNRSTLSEPSVKVTRTERVSPQTASLYSRSHLSSEVGKNQRVVDPSLPSTLSVIYSEYQFPVTFSETEDGDYYTIGNDPLSNPLQPIQPVAWDRIGSNFGQVHGVLMLSGVYGDESGFDPVIEGVSDLNSLNLLNTISEPTFTSDQFYPAQPHHFNHLSTLGDQDEEILVISAGQYDSQTETERLFDNLGVEVYYSNSQDEVAPQIGTFSYTLEGDEAQLSIPITDANGIYRVLATYTTGPTEDEDGNFSGEWFSVDFTPNGDGTWSGSLPESAWFFVQAVDTAGNVVADDNNGAYYRSPKIALSGSRSDSDVVLSWPHLGPDISYEVWRSTQPYFMPEDIDSSQIDAIPAESVAVAVGSPILVTDFEVVSDPDNYYYLIHAVSTDGETVAIIGRVGKFNLTLWPGWNLLALPLLPDETTLDGVIGSQLYGTENSFTADRVLVWDGESQGYEVAWFCGGAECESWGEPWANHWLANNYSPSPVTLSLNQGFWLQNRSGATETLVIVGKMAEEPRSVEVGEDWQLLGPAFLESQPLDESHLSPTGTESSFTADRILYWDAATQAYKVAWYCGGAECESWGEPWANHWLANNYAPTDIELLPGHGFWYQNRHDPFTWLDSRE